MTKNTCTEGMRMTRNIRFEQILFKLFVNFQIIGNFTNYLSGFKLFENFFVWKTKS